MILKKAELEDISEISIKAAKKAGEIIIKYKNKNFTIFNKTVGTSPASQALTEVDLLCENIILEILTPSIKKYDLGVLTEENEDNKTRLEKDYFFSVDPMDGTKSFIESKDGFSVSISLVRRDGIPIIGVVFDPIHNNLYHSILGRGLYKNLKKWSPKFNRSKREIKLLVDSSYKNRTENNIGFIEYGGAVLNALEVLEGRVDCYIKKPKKEIGGGSIWDFSSTVLFFNECGALAEDFFGKAIFLNNPETTFMNSYGVIFCENEEMKERVLSALKFRD